MKKPSQGIGTLSLFPGEPVRSISIVEMPEVPLTKDQKTFNGLIRKIEARRKKLAEWDAAGTRFRSRYADTLLPLQQQELKLQIQLAEALDSSHRGKGVTKGERRKLSALIVDLAEEILERTEHDGIKALYNRHSRSDFDAEEVARQEEMKSVLEAMLGVELGDDVDMGSPGDVLEQLESQYRSQQEESPARNAKRRPSIRQQARADCKEAEEKRLSQSIQTVYRKLASMLHPDREPDPQERQRKTLLMQRANEAYGKADLLGLLELQLELEQIDARHFRAIEPQLLGRYIKILKGQLSELDREVYRAEMEFVAQFSLPPFGRIDPKNLMSLLAEGVTACELDIRRLRKHLEAVGHVPRLKAWLKTFRLKPRPAVDFDFLF